MQAKLHSSDTIEAPESAYLFIGESQIPASGNGLHTAIDIYKDEVIAVFKGEILSDAQAKRRAKKKMDKYFISLLDGSIMDPMRVKCFAKYANDARSFSSRQGGVKNNAKIALDENNRVCLVATYNIHAGEEIFCSYGKRNWAKHG